MEPGKDMKNLKDMGTYIKKSLKFFDLKDETLTRLIFTIILLTGFVGMFIPEGASHTIYLIYDVLSLVIIYLSSAVYLLAYIKELKDEKCGLMDCVKAVGYNAARIIIASVLYGMAVFAGTVLLIVPGVVIYLMFLFNTCYIVDKNKGVMEAFKSSKSLTDGRKLEIFGVVLVFNLLLFLLLFIIMAVSFSYGNNMVAVFVIMFAGTIVNLMKQRLAALLYMDLEYGEKADG